MQSAIDKHGNYTVLTLKYGVNLLNASVSCVLRQNACATLRLEGCKRVFPLRYSDTRSILSQIISYSDTKVPVFVVMECKRVNVIMCPS